ncbi:MAG: hypothetical protein GYA23_04285 [Methanomicrobiales archaeon]|nr:hypothetical protein [Methanomicrobiales archaeon]
MDLQRMNTIAITLLLGGFVLLMLFLLGIMGLMQPDQLTRSRYFYLFVIVTGGSIIFLLVYAVRAIWGVRTPVRGAGPARFFANYIHKDTPRATGEKFFVLLFIACIAGVILSPAGSFERTVLYVCVFAFLIWFFVQWALEYDPQPTPGVKEEEYFTQAELDDPMSREIVVNLPAGVVLGYCINAIQTIWGRFVMIPCDAEQGTIDFMFADSHLSFVLTPLSETRTRVRFSIMDDIPRKWSSQNKDRRQNIRYLDRIHAELTRRIWNR